jgi:2-furoyl-CoA dehydrogenase FAD binding subunit
VGYAQGDVDAAMKAAPFDYLRPDTLDETLAALTQYGSDARIIAGGQSLGAMLNMRVLSPKALIDINGLNDLADVSVGSEMVATGAIVRQSDAMVDHRIRDHVPLLARALPYVGHYQTRNRGTLGGSVSHADPSAEILLALATLGGEVELRSRRGRRRLKAADFFQSALVTAREPDELLTALYWPSRKPRHGYAFTEFALRHGDYAIVAVACIAEMRANGALSALRFGFGGCGEKPQVVAREGAPGSERLYDETVWDMAQSAAAEIECRTDLMASTDYRRQLAGVLAGSALAATAAEAVAHA